MRRQRWNPKVRTKRETRNNQADGGDVLDRTVGKGKRQEHDAKTEETMAETAAADPTVEAMNTETVTLTSPRPHLHHHRQMNLPPPLNLRNG